YRVAGDDDHRHLHGECDKIPESRAEPLCRLSHRAADGDTSRKHDGNGHQSESKCIREPALEPIGESKTNTGEPRTGMCEDGLHAGEIIHSAQWIDLYFG